MKLHRFFIKDTVEDNLNDLEIDDIKTIHQMKNVLRLQVGDRVIISDIEGNECLCTLKVIMKKKVIFTKEDVKHFSNSDVVNLVLYPSMIKKDKLEYVLQKCTEIGVFKFCPLVSDRTEKLNFKIERAETIIKEAAEQSEKNRLPSINVPIGLSELADKHETDGIFSEECLVIYLDIGAPVLDVIQERKTLSEKKYKEIVIFVGPEGGWSETDRNFFKRIGAKPVSLGKTVLRAETASIAIASLMLLCN